MVEQSAASLAIPETAEVAHRPLRMQRTSPEDWMGLLRDIVSLAKPRLSSLVLFTTAGGLMLAPGHISWPLAVLTLVMTTLAVASANTLNCYLERETDALMKRTRARALPTGRLDAKVGLVVGIVLSLISIPALTWGVNPLAGALAALAVVSYVGVYTPMKQKSPWAVVVGALPGAIPPLLGWVAVTDRFDLGGLALFAVLFVWQIPHFLAIALYLREDYSRAGMRVLPVTHGVEVSQRWLVVSTALLVPVTLILTPLQVSGMRYLAVAGVIGVALFGWSVTGLKGQPSPRWARKFMLGTVTYLTILFIALAMDAT
jgi:protoheme IX farnesyltransferase